jgi:hypothetical protein
MSAWLQIQTLRTTTLKPHSSNASNRAKPPGIACVAGNQRCRSAYWPYSSPENTNCGVIQSPTPRFTDVINVRPTQKPEAQMPKLRVTCERESSLSSPTFLACLMAARERVVRFAGNQHRDVRRIRRLEACTPSEQRSRTRKQRKAQIKIIK